MNKLLFGNQTSIRIRKDKITAYDPLPFIVRLAFLLHFLSLSGIWPLTLFGPLVGPFVKRRVGVKEKIPLIRGLKTE